MSSPFSLPARRWLHRACLAFCLAVVPLLNACTSQPDGVTVVSPFDVKRYAGQWFEIARLDHSFERGLSDVNATYRLEADGSVAVINRGFDTAKGEWKEAVGKALFTGDTNTGSLKVSFFGPFYGGYHVIALDPGYRWAMVIGPNTDYLWILARDKQLPPGVREQLVAQAARLGVKTAGLIWVEHRRSDR
jgi:apolipoprotein D and lipocalin family protein